MRLGFALAHLAVEITTERVSNWPELNEHQKNSLQTLRDRRQEILSNASVDRIFKAIPAYACQTEKTYLLNNEEFFIAHFLITTEDGKADKYCERLSRHLNDCYTCFELFCDVMRDYYSKFRQLS